MILEVILYFYLGINLFLALGMTCSSTNDDSFSIYPSLIYSLREEYHLNKLGTAIVVALITILCLPAVVCSTIILTLMFCGLKLGQLFCKIFRRKDY